jgi:hypothetical protein
MFDRQISMVEIFQHPDCCIGIAVLQDDGKVIACDPFSIFRETGTTHKHVLTTVSWRGPIDTNGCPPPCMACSLVCKMKSMRSFYGHAGAQTMIQKCTWSALWIFFGPAMGEKEILTCQRDPLRAHGPNVPMPMTSGTFSQKELKRQNNTQASSLASAMRNLHPAVSAFRGQISLQQNSSARAL